MSKKPREKKTKIVHSPSAPVIVFEWPEEENAFLATIVSGLEDVGCKEITNKLSPSHMYSIRGKIVFSTKESPTKVCQGINCLMFYQY